MESAPYFRRNPSGILSRLLTQPVVNMANQVPVPDGSQPAAGACKPPMNPFQIFAMPDILTTLVFTGVVYATNYTVTSTISSSFAEVYPWLSETSLGLCYLPTGAGMILGSTIVGQVLDLDYRHLLKKLGSEDHGAFPVEYARLRLMPAHLMVFTSALVAWGWCVQKGFSMAVPLVLQVICKFLSNNLPQL